MLFSDETTLELHPNKRVLVHRLCNTGMEKKNFSETRNFGGKKLMLWVLLPTMFGNVSKKYGTMNSIKYFQILQESLLPKMFLGKKLQQDNAPAHISICEKFNY